MDYTSTEQQRLENFVAENPAWKKNKETRSFVEQQTHKFICQASNIRTIADWLSVYNYILNKRKDIYFLVDYNFILETMNSFVSSDSISEQDFNFFIDFLVFIKEDNNSDDDIVNRIAQITESLVSIDLNPWLYLKLQKNLIEYITCLKGPSRIRFEDIMTKVENACQRVELNKIEHEQNIEWATPKERINSHKDQLFAHCVKGTKEKLLPLEAPEKIYFSIYTDWLLSGLWLQKNLTEARYSSAFMNAMSSFHLDSRSKLESYSEKGSFSLEKTQASFTGLRCWKMVAHDSYVLAFIKHSFSTSLWFSEKEKLRLLRALSHLEDRDYGAAMYYLLSTLESSLNAKFSLPVKVETKDNQSVYIGSTLSKLLDELKQRGNESVKTIVESAKYTLTRSTGLNIRNTVFHGKNFIYETSWGVGLILLLLVNFSFINYRNGHAVLIVTNLSTKVRSRVENNWYTNVQDVNLKCTLPGE